MKAEYIDHYGSDDRVVDAARVSFDRIAENFTPEQNTKLIKYLADNEHWSPFAHVSVTLRETIPIFLARQRFKHRVGFEYNEVSRRYVDDEPEFYEPVVWRKRAENKKQGSSDEVVKQCPMYPEEGMRPPQVYIKPSQVLKDVHENCLWAYHSLLRGGVAPEQARMVLPQSMYTSYYVTGSLAAWARAYQQRTHEHAQREWDEVTQQWDKIIAPLFPESWNALVGK